MLDDCATRVAGAARAGQRSASVEAASGNIKGGAVGDWLVTGWFTPDYWPLAEKLAASLAQHNAPCHLWAKPKRGAGWDTRRKPSVVLETMEAYPGCTIVLMDVDCIVRGDLSPLTNIAGDVGLTVKARQVRGKDRISQKRVVLTASSRVVVFRPTEGARAFAREWERLCRQATTGGDEAHMIWAYLVRPDIAYTLIDPRYAGREITSDVADAVVVHDSAHDKSERWSIKPALKTLERRFFRTGRTKAEMQAKLG